MTNKQDAQKFLNDWRKQQGLEGTRVKPPTQHVPLHLRPFMKDLAKANGKAVFKKRLEA